MAHHRLPQTVIAATLLSFCGLAAYADTLDADTLGQIVVTATRTPKTLKDVPVSTRVLTADDIRKADVACVADLLAQELPGLEFAWAMSGETSLNMNGFGGNDILFLIDGERLAGETMNNTDYQRLSLDNIERIEIVRGAASSLYGSNAVGGVVNIITRRAEKPLSLGLVGRAGSHSDYRASLTMGARPKGEWGRLANMFEGAYSHAGEYRMAPFGGAVSNELVSRRNHTWNAADRLVWQPLQGLELTARAGFFYRERCYDATQNNRYRDFSGGLRGEYRFAPDHSLEMAYTFDQYDKSDYSLLTGSDVRDYSNVQNVLRVLYSNRVHDGLTLTAGADVMRDYLLSYMFSSGAHYQYTADAFVQADWEATPRWELVGGLRYDYYSASASNSVTGKLAARCKVNDYLTLRASYSGGFRAPTLKEMFMDFDMSGIFMIYGNSALKPERSHNLQASAELRMHGWNITAMLFHHFVANRITTLWDVSAVGLYGNMGAMCYRNIPSMDVCGAEAEVSRSFNRHWDARLAYAFNYVRTPEGVLYTDDTRPHSITARVGYTASVRRHTLEATLSARWLSALDVYELDDTYAAMNTTPTHYDGYALLKLSAQWRTPFGVSVSLSADNLLNYRPAVYTYYSPKTTGTTFTATLSYQL